MVSQIGKVATGQALEVYFGFDYGDSMEDEFWEAFKAFPNAMMLSIRCIYFIGYCFIGP